MYECDGWESKYDHKCSACEEGYGLVTGRASTCSDKLKCQDEPHVADRCVKFTSLEPSVCEEQKCAHEIDGTDPADPAACPEEKGCGMMSDSPKSGTTFGLHKFDLDLTDTTFWSGKTVTVTLVPAPPDPAGEAAEFYWERPSWNSKGDATKAVTFSADLDTWEPSTGQGSITLRIPEDVPAHHKAVITATFTRPGLYNLHVSVAGCYNGGSAVDCVFDSTSKAPLNVGPGGISLTATNSTFKIDKNRVANKWFEPVVSGDRFIEDQSNMKITQTTFNDNHGPDHDHHNITFTTTVLDDHSNPRIGHDELLVELIPDQIAGLDLPTVLLATKGLMLAKQLQGDKPVEIGYGDPDSGKYLFNHSLQTFGVYSVNVWLCDRVTPDKCNTHDGAMPKALMGGTIPKFTLCPQNTADKSALTDGTWSKPADFFQTGSHLDTCQCLPGFHSATGTGRTCASVEAGQAGPNTFGGKTAEVKTCGAGTSCGCEVSLQTQAGYAEDCQSNNWNPGCTVDKSGNCQACKKQSYQNLPGMAGCWACGNGEHTSNLSPLLVFSQAIPIAT